MIFWRWHLFAVFPLLLRTIIPYCSPISLFGSKRNNGHAWWHRIYAPATIYSRVKVKWQRYLTIEDLPSKIYVQFLSLCKQLRRKFRVQETTTATTMPKINDSTWWVVEKKTHESIIDFETFDIFNTLFPKLELKFQRLSTNIAMIVQFSERSWFYDILIKKN